MERRDQRRAGQRIEQVLHRKLRVTRQRGDQQGFAGVLARAARITELEGEDRRAKADVARKYAAVLSTRVRDGHVDPHIDFTFTEIERGGKAEFDRLILRFLAVPECERQRAQFDAVERGGQRERV